MDMINIVAIAPAELLPIPPNRNDGRLPPPRTTSYLLLPRAGTIMVDPPPITACLTQAGLFHSSSRLKIRRDGYFLEELRTLARSARDSKAPFAHSSIVNIEEYATQNAATATALARTLCLYSTTDARPGPPADSLISTQCLDTSVPHPSLLTKLLTLYSFFPTARY